MVEKEDLINLQVIKNKKLYNPEIKKEISFEEVYKILKDDELVYVRFFVKYDWLLCKSGALDLSKTVEKINEEYPGKVKFIGVSTAENGFVDFKKNYFRHDLYVNQNKTIYKAINLRNPGFLACFGFCTKKVSNRTKEVKSKYDIDIKIPIPTKLTFEFGGSMIINKKGVIIFQYKDTFFGDRAREQDILTSLSGYFKY